MMAAASIAHDRGFHMYPRNCVGVAHSLAVQLL